MQQLRGVISCRKLRWVVVAILGVVYLINLTPGHALIPDDYAAYIMHASNLVHGQAYGNIKFIANPDAMWMGPAEGYPPIYPLMLAPIERGFGLNFRAMKVLTVACFVIFLILFLRLTDSIVPRWGQICLLLMIGSHPFFREYGDYVLSEMPYLLFSFAALVMVGKCYGHMKPDEWHIREAMTTAVLIYCAYGTRTIGISLLAALGAADFVRFRRPSRYFLLVLGAVLVLVAIQMKIFTPPQTYVKLTNFSPGAMLAQFVTNSKRLSYVWANGWSKPFQVFLAILMTLFAAAGFLRALWRRGSVTEFYLLAYTGILAVYTVNLYDRGLLPIVPLYFLYGLEGVLLIAEALNPPARTALVFSLALLVVLTYAGNYRARLSAGSGPNTQDRDFQQMCKFINTNTQPSEVIAFPKPRSLALFTGRRTTGLAWDETPTQAASFLERIHATLVIEADWQPSLWKDVVVKNHQGQLVFSNSTYKVFRIKPV